MVSSQIIRGCLEQLKAITRIEFCVLDTAGGVVAQTEGVTVPDRNLVSGFAKSAVDSQIVGNSYFLKIMDDEELQFVLTAQGNAEHTFMVAKIAVSEIENLITAYKEKFDRSNFFQNLLLDNLLLVDIHNRAKKLHIELEARRVVFILELENERENSSLELIKGTFDARPGDFVTAVDEKSVIVIRELIPGEGSAEMEATAGILLSALPADRRGEALVSYGTVVGALKEVSRSYKEARMALHVGKVFYPERQIMAYSSLGIGRLIYQLPIPLCKMFIKEVFEGKSPDDFDEETLSTINKFF